MPRARSRRSSSADCVSASICPRSSAVFAGVALGELAGEPRLHRERDELLLGAVVDVPLQPPALLVLGRHEPLPGRPEVLARAARSAGRAPPARPGRGRACPSTGSSDRRRASGPTAPRAARPGPGPRRRFAGDVVPAAIAADRLPTMAASRGHAAAGWSSPPTRSHTRAVSAPVPSPSTCAIRGRTSSVAKEVPIRSENSVSTSYGVARSPVHQAVGDPPAHPHRRTERDPERQRDREQQGGPIMVDGRAAPISATAPAYTATASTTSEPGHDGLLHDDVEVPQAVLQDRDPDGHRETGEHEAGDDLADRCPRRCRAASRIALTTKYTSEHDGGEREPLQLLALHTGRSAEADEHRGDRRRDEEREQSGPQGPMRAVDRSPAPARAAGWRSRCRCPAASTDTGAGQREPDREEGGHAQRDPDPEHGSPPGDSSLPSGNQSGSNTSSGKRLRAHSVFPGHPTQPAAV